MMNYCVDIFYKHLSPAKTGYTIANVCWNIRQSIAQFETMKIARTYLQTYVFIPQNILCRFDMTSAVCNLSDFQIICNVENWDNDLLQNNKPGSTTLPHKWKVQQ